MSNNMSRNVFDQVEHADHYNRENAIECIEEMILIYGEEETATFCKLNAHKYRYRAGTKEGNSGIVDLCKSDWYMRKYVELKDKTKVKKYSIDYNPYGIGNGIDSIKT